MISDEFDMEGTAAGGEEFVDLLRRSTDDGQSWSEPLVIADDGAGYDLGYPSTVELDDGTLLTVWYEKLAERQHAVLRQARWKLAG